MAFSLQFDPVVRGWQDIASGVGLTVGLSAIAIACGFTLAIVLAALRTAGPRPLGYMIATYVEIMRNTPFLIQLFIIFFGLPSMGVKLSAVEAGALGLTLNLAAYASEIVRAGVESIHRSQIEAGLSLALTRRQVFQYVVLTPALKNVWPALTSQFVLTLLASSVCSFISVEELSGAAAYMDARTFRSFEIYITVTGCYFALSFLLRTSLEAIGDHLLSGKKLRSPLAKARSD